MAIQIHASKRTAAREPGPRHLWLAALGMLVAVRRDARTLLRSAAGRVARRRKPLR